MAYVNSSATSKECEGTVQATPEASVADFLVARFPIYDNNGWNNVRQGALMPSQLFQRHESTYIPGCFRLVDHLFQCLVSLV